MYFLGPEREKRNLYSNLNKPGYLKPEVDVQKVPQEIKPFVSCGCIELITFRLEQIKHKINCPKFWELNPGRTKDELLKSEGFL